MFHPKIKDVLCMPRIPSHTADWYKYRQQTQQGKCRLTASDLASVLGLNPYCSRLEVFKRKTNQVPSFNGNAATAWGQRYESEADRMYVSLTGNETICGADIGEDGKEDIGLLIHPLFPQFGGSPDRLLKYRPILVEIKCPRYRAIRHEVPSYYLPQVQMLLWICDLEEAHFVQYCPGTLWAKGELDVVVVKRDRAWMNSKLPEMIRFCEEVDAYNAQTRSIPCVPASNVRQAVGSILKPETRRPRKLRVNVLDLMENEARVRLFEDTIDGCLVVEDADDVQPLPLDRLMDLRVDHGIACTPHLVRFDYEEEYKRLRSESVHRTHCPSYRTWTWEPDTIFASTDTTERRNKRYKPSVCASIKNG